MDTEFSHWEEWKLRCDLKACGEDTQRALLQYIEKRAGGVVANAAATTGRAPGKYYETTGWEWWRIVESFYHIPDKDGRKKPYKDWLFLRVQESSRNSPAYVAEAFVTSYFLRSAIRNWLIEQCPRVRNCSSLDAPVSTEDSDGTTLRDLTPDPYWQTSDEPVRREYKRIAAALATLFFERTSVRERVGLTAIYLRLPLSAPEVMAAAGCRHAVLSTAPKTLAQRLAEELRQRCPGEPPDGIQLLFRFTLEILEDFCLKWARSEKCCAPVFSLLERRQLKDLGEP
jgi:hypothetical protein